MIRLVIVTLGAGYLEKMQRIPVREALRNEVMLAHTEELWLRVNSLAGERVWSLVWPLSLMIE